MEVSPHGKSWLQSAKGTTECNPEQEADKNQENTASSFSKRQWKVTISSGRGGSQGPLAISPGGDTPHLGSWGRGASIRSRTGRRKDDTSSLPAPGSSLGQLSRQGGETVESQKVTRGAGGPWSV